VSAFAINATGPPTQPPQNSGQTPSKAFTAKPFATKSHAEFLPKLPHKVITVKNDLAPREGKHLGDLVMGASGPVGKNKGSIWRHAVEGHESTHDSKSAHDAMSVERICAVTAQ
jgi:hypothetical protein